MQKFTDKHRFFDTDRGLGFFIRRGKRRPATAAFAEQAAAIRVSLRQVNDVYVEAVEDRLSWTAEINYADARLDRMVIGGLKRDFVAMVGDGPDAPRLEKKLFQGVAPSVGMRTVATPEQESYVSGIVKRLNEDEEFAPLSAHAVTLVDGQSVVDAAIKGRKDAKLVERFALGNLDDALDAAHRFYNQLYPQLQLLFPNDADLVESYFLDLRGTKGEGSEAGKSSAEKASDTTAEKAPAAAPEKAPANG